MAAALVGLLIAGIGGLLFSARIFAVPERTALSGYTVEDGRSGQQKLAEIALRERGLSRDKGPVIITQRELNGFLAHHLEKSSRIPMNPLIVRLTPGILEIQGQTTVVQLLAGFPFSLLADFLPRSYLEQPIWGTVSGRIKYHPARWSLEVLDFSLGRQPISPWLLSWMLGRKGQQLFHGQAPGSVERIVIEDGRIVVFTRQ
jgi:hypothetical protein